MKSLGNFPDPFIAEISRQPEALRRAAAGLEDQVELVGSISRLAAELNLVFTGMGSSYDACYPAVTEITASRIPASMVDAAELLHFRSAMLGPRTVLVVVSQSGESAEIVRLITELRQLLGRPTVVAVTNGRSNTLARLADVALDTSAGEESGPSTITFAASLVVLSALARALAGDPAAVTVARCAQEADRAASDLDRLLADGSLPGSLIDWFGDRDRMVVLGRGPARAAAEMGALTIKEAAGIPIESIETAQFRHGPRELSGPGLAALVIATEPETRDLDLRLAGELVATGSAVLTIAEGALPPIDGAMHVGIRPLDRTLRPAVSIFPLQLLAWKLAMRRGREPGSYVRASKVTLDE